MQKPRTHTILYCYAGHSVFGKRDIEWMSQMYNVKVAHFEIKTDVISKLMSYLAYNIRVLWLIWKADTVVINFGSWHAVSPVALAKLINKRSIISLGGFDAASIPSLEYGVFYRNNLLQKVMRWTYRQATYICPVSDALVYFENKYADPSGVGYKTGILHFLPELKPKIRVVPPLLDFDFWQVGHEKRNDEILALAYVYNPQTYHLKGFDLIVACAKELPEHQFTFAGFSPEMVSFYQSAMPDNVTLLSFQTKEKSKQMYQDFSVFLMPSMTEGMGNTFCEAMLCGCTPVVSDVSILKTLVGDDNYVVLYRDIELLKKAILYALKNPFHPDLNRDKVIDYFKDKDRIKLMSALINQP
jgi:glycosyltransferase involved in cell wall biosynthesis